MVKAKENKEPIFVEPEFSEKEFLIDERNRAKSTLMVIAMAALLGLASGYMEIEGYWYLATVIFIFALLFFFKLLQALRIHIPKRTSQKFFLFASFLLTWVVFWIIALNPPLNVISSPSVSMQQDTSNSWAGMASSNGQYILTISPHATSYSIRAAFSYVYKITGANISLMVNSGSYSVLSSNFNNGYLYFNLSQESLGITDYLHITMISNGKTFSSTQEVFFNS